MLLSEMIQGATAILQSGWTQGATARDAEGQRCSVDEGVSFCASGALHRIYWDNRGPTKETAAAAWKNFCLAHEYLDAVNKVGVLAWNDDPVRTLQEVITTFERVTDMALQNEKLGIVT